MAGSDARLVHGSIEESPVDKFKGQPAWTSFQVTDADPQGHTMKHPARGLQELCDARFCPVILRHGVAYGLSPCPQFVSVPNGFVMEAVSQRRVTLPSDASLMRPFVDVADLAEAHFRCLQAPEARVRGQIFNVVHANLCLAHAARIVTEAEGP